MDWKLSNVIKGPIEVKYFDIKFEKFIRRVGMVI